MILATNARQEISTEAVIVAAIQEKLIKAGWQFQERIFNDGDWRNCMISMTQETDHANIIHLDGRVGWGRFDRVDAWEQADSFVDRWQTVAAYRAAGSPHRRDW